MTKLVLNIVQSLYICVNTYAVWCDYASVYLLNKDVFMNDFNHPETKNPCY